MPIREKKLGDSLPIEKCTGKIGTAYVRTNLYRFPGAWADRTREHGGNVVYAVSVWVWLIVSDDKSYKDRENVSERLMSSGWW